MKSSLPNITRQQTESKNMAKCKHIPVHKRQKSLESFRAAGPRAGKGGGGGEEAGRGRGRKGRGRREGAGQGPHAGPGGRAAGGGPGAEALTVRAVGESDPLGR